VSWEARLGGQAADADAEKAVIDALHDFLDAHPVGYNAIRTEFWGEGDVHAVSDGHGARSPGQAAEWAEAQPPPDSGEEVPPQPEGPGDDGEDKPASGRRGRG
jgi:hypothetical protein